MEKEIYEKKYQCKGDKIRELRKKKDKSQQWMADVVGVSRTAYQSWENGGNIEVSNAEKLAKALKVKMEDVCDTIPEALDIEEITEMIDSAWLQDPEGCLELLKKHTTEFEGDEREIAEKYYVTPEEYDPEIGLDLGLMDEDVIKDEILTCILQGKSKTIFHKSMKETRSFLNGPVRYSESTIKMLEEETRRMCDAIKNQEVCCSWEDTQKLMGRDFALMEALGLER